MLAAARICQLSRGEKILVDAFADHNQERIHSAIEYMTPVEFASQWEMKNKWGRLWMNMQKMFSFYGAHSSEHIP